jgi:hypothetical protein
MQRERERQAQRETGRERERERERERAPTAKIDRSAEACGQQHKDATIAPAKEPQQPIDSSFTHT